MYNAVPAVMLKSVLRFHTCRIITSKHDKASGRKYAPVFRRQYTTSMAMTEYGNTLPKYRMNAGVFLLNAINGMNLRNAVTAPEMITSINASYILILNFPPERKE